MPFINLKTNQKIEKSLKDQLKAEFGRAISLIPGKSEGWLMVEIEDAKDMYFKGSDEPCAIYEVKIYGNASDSSMNNLTSTLCDLSQKYLNIPKSRVYVAYFPTDSWGWNGNNF